MSLHDQIQSLVAKFAQDLEALVRSAAVSAVQSALGAAPAARASVPTSAAPRLKPGPKPKAAAPTAAAAPAATKSRKGKRVRRSLEQIKATADKIHGYVKANSGANAEKIKKALGIPSNEWSRPLALLIDGKRLASKGEKRATTYTAR